MLRWGTAGQELLLVSFVKWWLTALAKEEAYKRFLHGRQTGLLFDDMDDLTPEQRPFAKKRSDFCQCR